VTEPILQVRDLAFHYPDGRFALRGLTFAIEPGERVALVGPNGAGKSTLLLHLNGLLPGKGYEHHHHGFDLESHRHAPAPSVFVHGKPATPENMSEVRRAVGLLFQDPDDQLFCPTVMEDVVFGPLNFGVEPAAARQRAVECLRRVGLEGFEDRAANHLSFGERKRACLAGVLACEPSVLVLDEPTANLDPRARRQLIALLQDLPAAMVVATHDLEMALRLCPRTLVLDGGRLVADGPTRHVLADEELMLERGLEVPLSLQPAEDRASGSA